MPASPLDDLSINTIRFLSADAVQNASSGHPGLPMGGAAMAYVLWTRFMCHNPANPAWPDRDRFILSAGHGSMLHYSLLHLTGYDLSLDDIRAFRQWGSATPGHPEARDTPGVEATTGPLGQGLSNAVGFAMAEAHLAATFNRPGHQVVDHYTYVIASDGDVMEGVSNEACSLAGHLKLGKLIVLYDANEICLSGSTSLSFSEDVGARLAAQGWHVERVDDGNDLDALGRAIEAAREAADQPSVIVVRSIIGFGAPNKQGTYVAHGSPLGDDELRAAKEGQAWPVEPLFHLPESALAGFRAAIDKGRTLENDWTRRLEAYALEYPGLAGELRRRLEGRLPVGWEAALPTFEPYPKGLATRKASETIMQALAEKLPELMGGSADLNNSTFTWLKGKGDFESPRRSSIGAQGLVGGGWGFEGRNIHFGVREHAMGAVANGMALHGGFIPYGSTFLIFSDYMRPALRLSAIMKVGAVWVYTHDGIGVGEDGPTHQPVEHYMALRAIPGLLFVRPGDANETVEAWKVAIRSRNRPTALALTRQGVPTLDRSELASAEGLARGGYVLNPGAGQPDVVLLASGSEVSLIVAAEAELRKQGVSARLVSLPCWELFDEQPAEYRDEVIPPAVTARLAVETGVRLGWERWIGAAGETITMDRFGASAPGGVLMKQFGFTVDNVVDRALRLAGK